MEKTPGVYIKEIGLLPSSVAPISTAIPAFIGYTEKGGGEGRPLDRQAVRINSLLEYERLYGKADNQQLTITVDDTITDNPVPVSVAVSTVNPSPYLMYYQVLMYFLNGGGPCYIISVNGYQPSGVRLNDLNEVGNTTTTASHRGGLAVARKVDEITLLVFPDAPALSDRDYYGLYQDALKQCSELQDRFTLIDVKDPVSVTSNDGTAVSPIVAFRGTTTFPGIGINYLNYGAAYYPYLNTTLSYQYDSENWGSKLSFVGNNGAINAGSLRTNTQFIASLERLIAGFPVTLPPSGAIAGIYAQTDRTRGVFKAPANVSLNSVISPVRKITDEEQQELNVHPSGKSINAIRAFAGKGVLVWGARTLEGNSNEWRYISVRRFFLFVEESLRKAIEPFVFEGNNENTWIRIRGLIENFLTSQWRAGALFGGTPSQAFFVNIGLGATMSAQDILEGKLIAEIGMAAVRPAEFIILKFTHRVQNA